MREVLAAKLVEQAKISEEFILLTGDHGYALFDPLRKEAPDRFVNVGIMEQSMLGMAAGLCAVGYKPVVYGLSSFVPMRVLEQIKLDICFSKSPVKIIGDGAGVVYSVLGNSHFCTEDVGVLMTLPEIEIYCPGDEHEMEACLREFFESDKPAYLRVGKADNPSIGQHQDNTTPYFSTKEETDVCLVSMGSMNGISHKIAKDQGLSHISIMKIKPYASKLTDMLQDFKKVIVIEEHQKIGGLKSAIMEDFSERNISMPSMSHFCFKDSFTEKCGSYQYALSEHGLDFETLENEVKKIIG